MTSYNRENLIEESIQSVLNSSFENFEFIIVDDASTDSTWEIILKYAKIDSRIKTFRNQFNIGDYQNRNKAASYAKGKYLKYVDSDDLIFKNTLFEIIKKMEDNPKAAFGLSAELDWIIKKDIVLLNPEDLFTIFIFEGKLLGCSPTGSIIRRDAFEKTGGFSGKQYIGDTELWLKLASNYSAIVFDKDLYYWREHQDQQIKFEKKNRFIKYDRFILLQSYIHSFEYLNENIKKIAARNIKSIVSRNILCDMCLFKINAAINDKRGYGLNIIDLLLSLLPNRYPLIN